jgi:hypothetical protein
MRVDRPEGTHRAEVLAVLHAVPELRARVGAASRASVEKYQSFDAVAQVWTRIYRHVWWGEPLRLEQTIISRPSASRAPSQNIRPMATSGRSRCTT